jgi:hypothetical protein
MPKAEKALYIYITLAYMKECKEIHKWLIYSPLAKLRFTGKKKLRLRREITIYLLISALTFICVI